MSRTVLRYGDGGWAEAIGGHVALDLVNTVAWRPDPARTVDLIPDGRSLVEWTHFVGLVDAEQADVLLQRVADDPAGTDRTAADVRRARELTHQVLVPLAREREPDRADVERLHGWLIGVLGRARVASTMPLEWATDLSSVDTIADELGLHVWRLLEREDARRIRQCRDDDCGWLFLDRTKNSSRVWCSSGDCGNRERARRHYRAHRTVSS